jgi:chitodextrinase
MSLIAIYPGPAVAMNSVEFSNNIVEQINITPYNGRGDLFIFLSPPATDNVIINHNTIVSTGPINSIAAMDPGSGSNVAWDNNIMMNGVYGVKTGGVTSGDPSLASAFNSYTFKNNALIGGSGPVGTGTYFPSNIAAVNFVNAAAGNYTIASGALKNGATDGKDVGADIAMVNAMTATAISGNGTGVPTPPPASDTTPPTVPTGLSKGTLTQTSVALSWSASTDNVGVAGYRVYRNGSLISSPLSNTYTDSSLIASTTYSYTVIAYDAAGNSSSQSAALSVTTPANAPAPDTTPPTVPAGLSKGTLTQTSVVLNWTPSTDNVGVLGYKIYRNGILLSSLSSTTYTDSGLTASSTYSYTVAAFDAAGNTSAQSAALSVTTLAAITPPPTSDTQAPSKPTGLTLIALTSTSVNLTWTASTDNVAVAGYRVYRDGTLLSSPVVTTYTDSGLTALSTYSYRIESFDAAGNSSTQSDIRSVTTPAAAVIPPVVPPVTPPVTGVTLPPGLLAGDIASFGSQPYYLVESDGLHPFDTASSLTLYISTSGKQIRPVTTPLSNYTVSTVTAAQYLNQSVTPPVVPPVVPPVTPPAGSTPAVGTNLLYNGTVYFFDGSKLRPYTSSGAFLSYGFNSFARLTPSNSTYALIPQAGFAPPMDGSLINDKGTVYLIVNGKRAGFTSETVFLGLGFSFANVLPGDTSFMTTLPPINTITNPHPAGTLVIDSTGTVYLVGPTGKVGIPTMSVFTSWGFNLKNVVKANQYDISSSLPTTAILQTRPPDQLNALASLGM